MNAPVFVVGLERVKKERYEPVLRWLKERGVEARLWPAVDGDQPIRFEENERVARWGAQLLFATKRGPLVKAEVGCFLSHYRLMKHALAQGWERIFVLEDDVVATEHFSQQALDALARLPQSFEYVHFGNQRSFAMRRRPVAHLPDFALHKPVATNFALWGTWGYAVSRQGIKTLLPLLTPIRYPIDVTIELSAMWGLNSFVLKPNIVRPNPELSETIHERKYRGGWLRHFLNILPFEFYDRTIRWNRRHIIARKHPRYGKFCEFAELAPARFDAPPAPAANGAAPAQARKQSGGLDFDKHPLYIIGLERCKKERYEAVLRRLKERGVEARVWPAADGAKPLLLEDDEQVDWRGLYMLLTRNRAPLLRTEIAVYLSHYRLLKRAYAQGWERLFVLEDDVIPTAAFSPAALNAIARLPQEFEYVHFANETPQLIRKRPVARLPQFALHKPVLRSRYDLTGCLGYAISRQGIERLLPLMTPIRNTIDLMIEHNALSRLKVFLTEPNLVAHDWDGETTVHQELVRSKLQRWTVDILPNKPTTKAFRIAHRLYQYPRWLVYTRRCARAEAAPALFDAAGGD